MKEDVAASIKLAREARAVHAARVEDARAALTALLAQRALLDAHIEAAEARFRQAKQDAKAFDA